MQPLAGPPTPSTTEQTSGQANPSKKRKREARKQAQDDDVFDYPHSGLYNIWYDRVQDYSTWRDRRDAKLQGKRYKLDCQRDTGTTKARGAAYCCLYFARGKCVMGKDCAFYHRLPTANDEARIDMLHDIFGRDRHKEDMGGVGNFTTNNKSLYVGGIKIIPKIEEILFQHFSQFGMITYLRVLHGRSIAFIQYKYRVCAEFAKEAMGDQSIIKNEVLNVRWANDHPNEQVQRQKEDKLQIEAWKKMKEKFPRYFDQYESLQNEEYPDTDEQFLEMPPIFLPDNAFGDDGMEEQALADAKKVLKAIKAGTYEGDDILKASGGQWGEDTMGKYYYWNVDELEDRKLTREEKEEQERKKKELQEKKEKAKAQKETFLGEVQNYMAWQSYYASQGYPGYWNEYGVYHYYDPNLYLNNKEVATAVTETKQAEAKEAEVAKETEVPQKPEIEITQDEGTDIPVDVPLTSVNPETLNAPLQ